MPFSGSHIQLVEAMKSSPRSANSHMCISYHIITCEVVLCETFMSTSYESLCAVTFRVSVRELFLQPPGHLCFSTSTQRTAGSPAHSVPSVLLQKASDSVHFYVYDQPVLPVFALKSKYFRRFHDPCLLLNNLKVVVIQIGFEICDIIVKMPKANSKNQ